MIALLEEDTLSIMNLIFAAVFMVGGVFMVIQTLRHSLFKSKVAIEEEERRKQARAKFWRTMDSTVDNLTNLIDDIEAKIDDRSQQLEKLSTEAEASIAELAKSLEAAESALKRGHAKRKDAATKAGRRASGKVVDMKAAGAALVRRTHRQVYESFDMGQDIQQISRETGLGIGEIELILALRERIERQGS